MIKTATEQLQQAFYKVSEKMYQQAAPNGAAPGADPSQTAGGADNGQTYYDADYTEVDPNN